MNNTPSPCSMCHFCIEPDKPAASIRVCVWYDSNMGEAEANDSSSKPRTDCLNDGDNFVWRMKRIDPISYARWRSNPTPTPVTITNPQNNNEIKLVLYGILIVMSLLEVQSWLK